MGTFLNLKSMLFLILTSKFQFLIPFHQKVSQNSMYLVGLMQKLIKESKDKLTKGGVPTSMLDFMVQAFFEGEMSDDELEANVFIFFIAGHETYLLFFN
jgi:cytochrome P450